MAGIYIHIPYCQQACHYCDFHFSTTSTSVNELISCLEKEIVLQKDYLGDEVIETIYFGGGTPSYVLSGKMINNILDVIRNNYNADKVSEITFEANPEDLSKEYLQTLWASGINRLSIGIQSFNNDVLRVLNRVHNKEQAINCVHDAISCGFDNISIDLMYGLPEQSLEVWNEQINIALSLPVQHISAYCMAVSPKTYFHSLESKGKLILPTEETILQQFKLLISLCEKAGFNQYEICSFCKEGFKSKHNSNYWANKNYLGIGPSAHSYNGHSRQWNVRSNQKYIRNISDNSSFYEIESIDDKKRFNELILTSLRTREGVKIADLSEKFDNTFATHFAESSQSFIDSGHLIEENKIYRLTIEGQLIADRIAMELFVD